MRLRDIFIDGFGVFANREFRDLDQGLTVFHGPNEAGKSTLLAFIRSGLFGPQKKAKAYQPLAGGRHGGRIALETESGAVVVEREFGRKQPSRISLDRGLGSLSELSESEFQQLIGGVDEPTFRTVFAFSLEELSSLDTLSENGIRSRIFGAGVGGAGPSVAQVIKRFDATSDDLRRPRAGGAINIALKELAECERDLAAARMLAQKYPALLQERDSLRAQLQQLDERERQLRHTVTRCERLTELWPSWVDVEASRQELAMLQPVDTFISDARSRLTEAKGQYDRSMESCSRLAQSKDDKQLELDQLRQGMNDALWALATGVEQQSARIPFYRDQVRQLRELEGRVERRERDLTAYLDGLGSGVDRQSLVAIDTSLARLDEVRQWRDKLAEVSDAVRTARERADTAAAQRGRAEAELRREQESLSELQEVDAADLDRQVEAIRELRVGVAELAAKQAGYEARAASPAATPSARGPLLIWVTALLAIVLVVVLVAFSHPLLALVPVVLFLLVLVAWLTARRNRTQRGAGNAASLKDEIDRMRAQLTGVAAVVGLSNLPDSREVEKLDARLSNVMQAAQARGQQAKAVQVAEGRLAPQVEEETNAKDRAERLAEQQRALQAQFRDHVASLGLPGSLSPEALEELLGRAARAKEMAARIGEDLAELENARSAKNSWELETIRLIKAMQLAVEGGADAESVDEAALDAQLAQLDSDTLEAILGKLLTACRAEGQVRDNVRELENACADLEVQLADRTLELTRATVGLRDLYQQADVTGEEEFLNKHTIYERRKELRGSIDLAEDLLVKTVGKGEDTEVFRAELSTGALDAWQDSLEAATGELQGLRQQRAEQTKAEGDIERRLSELEQSADVPALEIALEGQRSELDTLVQRWRTYNLASVLVKETLAQFTLERQPQVLSEASAMFEAVTAGRYKRIRQQLDEKDSLVVVGNDEGIKTPDALSRGTAEQLYLCLRLSLADEFARRAETIPLLMDDVLVNFDSGRRRRTAELLLECAERHQILFFTCHEDTAALLRELRPDARMIAL